MTLIVKLFVGVSLLVVYSFIAGFLANVVWYSFLQGWNLL